MKVVSETGNLGVINLFQGASCLNDKGYGDSHFPTESVALNTCLTVKEDNEKKQSSPDYDKVEKCRLEGLCLNSHSESPVKGSLVKKVAVDKSVRSSNDLCPGQEHQKLDEVHFEDGNNDKSYQAVHCNSNTRTSICHQTGTHALPNLFKNPSIPAISEQDNNSTMSSIHQLPCFPPFTLFQSNQDSYHSCTNISPAFTNLIMSALLQNPAAHAAASLMASFWPSIDTDVSLNSTAESLKVGISVRPVNSSLSATAIAAATVAAATAWWATHGFFPLCHPPCPTGMNFVSAEATTNQATQVDRTAEGNDGKNNDSKFHSSEGRQALATESKKFSTFLSLDSDDSGRGGTSHAAKIKDSDGSRRANELLCTTDTGILDYNNKARNKKKQDRSSCGSNTTSSGEETEEKLDKAEELKKAQLGHPVASEMSNRRARSNGGINESWKEVSQEGRQAFQALFSREVLPQSFSSPQVEESVANNGKKEKGSNTLLVDLNKKAWGDHEKDLVLNETPMRDAFYFNRSSSTSRRMGFKPYKRCSDEAKEGRETAGEDKNSNNKRIRME